MSQRPPSDNPLAHLWGSFQAAVNDPEVRAQPGGVQQFVWQSVRNDFLSRGEPIPPGSFQAVNSLLSLAGQQRQASAAFDRALADYRRTGLDAALTGPMIARDIDARSLDAQLGGARFRVRFEASVMFDGELGYTRFTWDPGLELPQTVGGLLAGLDQAAAAAAADYDLEYQGDAAVLSITSI